MMLLAARALTFMADVLPNSCGAIVRHGAVAAFCQRLLTIEYIDLAEQSLQVCEVHFIAYVCCPLLICAVHCSLGRNGCGFVGAGWRLVAYRIFRRACHEFTWVLCRVRRGGAFVVRGVLMALPFFFVPCSKRIW